MLTKAAWLPLAESLALEDGRSRRVNHDCGEGRTLKLSREGNKLKAYCWRCNDWGIHELQESLAERIDRLHRQRAGDSALMALSRSADGEVNPDAGFQGGVADPSEWPVAARLWFAKAGLHSGDIGRLGAVYDPVSQRVILPCGGGFWQGRAINPGQQPKYLAPLVPKVYPRWGAGHTVTLTEDILSAYKVGKAGAFGLCMLGTSLPAELLADILSQSLSVNVWLDNDLLPLHPVNRGQIAAKKVITQLRSLGVSVRNIVTEHDPKLIHLQRIKEILQ